MKELPPLTILWHRFFWFFSNTVQPKGYHAMPPAISGPLPNVDAQLCTIGAPHSTDFPFLAEGYEPVKRIERHSDRFTVIEVTIWSKPIIVPAAGVNAQATQITVARHRSDYSGHGLLPEDLTAALECLQKAATYVSE